MRLRKYPNDEAQAILRRSSSEWEWLAKGYVSNADVVVFLGIDEANQSSSNPGRYLLLHQPVYLYYGERDTAGRGYYVDDVSEVDAIRKALIPATLPVNDFFTFALKQGSSMVRMLVMCKSCSMHIDEGIV